MGLRVGEDASKGGRESERGERMQAAIQRRHVNICSFVYPTEGKSILDIKP